MWPGSASGLPYSIGINGGVFWYSAPATASHKFYTNGTNTFTIDTTGNVSCTGLISSNSGISQFKYIYILLIQMEK